MEMKIREQGSYKVVELSGRIDSFNHDQIVSDFQNTFVDCTSAVCIDLTRVDFLGLQTIRFFNEQARKWRDQGLNFRIVGGNDKTRRHLEIFGDLKFLELVEDIEQVSAHKSSQDDVEEDLGPVDGSTVLLR